MDFIKLRLFRELKKKHAHEIAANKSHLDELPEEELYNILIALELDEAITTTINRILDASDDFPNTRMCIHVLAASIGNIMNHLGKNGKGDTTAALYREVLDTVRSHWSKK